MFRVSKKKIRSLLVFVQARQWRIDALFLIGLFVLNPLTYGLRLPLGLFPDAIGYLSFAELGLTKGLLYLPGWIHVDSGAIFPPLYPLLIATLNTIRPESITNAIAISHVCALLLTFPIYFYVRQFAPAMLAAVAVLLVQFSVQYVLFAGSALTESLFMLLLTSTMFLAMQLTAQKAPKTSQALILGLVAALVFFTRQIGLVVGAFFLFWFALDAVRRHTEPWQHRLRLPVFFLVGWMALLLPYVALLYHQTGQAGLQQIFRTHHYVVTSSDTALLDTVAQLKRTDNMDYDAVYANRRKLRQLLPDSSEMLGYVVPVGNGEAIGKSNLDNEGVRFTRSTGQFARNLSDNGVHFIEEFGWFAMALCMLALVSPFVVRAPSRFPRWPRLMLPGFIITYVLALSLMTGAVARYVTILFPIAVIQLVTELGIGYYRWREHKTRRWIALGAMTLALAPLLAFAIQNMLLLPLQPFFGKQGAALVKQTIVGGEPTFAMLPVYSYLAGGTFRVIPNDSLEKVVHYGRLTGVRWLLIPRQPDVIPDTASYTNATWLHDPDKLTMRTNLVRYCCTIDVAGENLVFEILPAQ